MGLSIYSLITKATDILPGSDVVIVYPSNAGPTGVCATDAQGTQFLADAVDCGAYCVCNHGDAVRFTCAQDFNFGVGRLVCDYSANVACGN